MGKFVSFNTIRNVSEFVKHYFVGIFKGIDDHHIFLSAAGIAYSLILSVIPFLLIVVSLFANLIEPDNVLTQINTLIETVLPYPEYAQYVENFFHTRLTEVIQYKTLTAYIGSFALFFTSTWLFSSMRTSLNKIFGVSNEKSAWIGLLRDFGMVVLLILFVLVLTIGFPLLEVFQKAADQYEVFAALRTSELLDLILTYASPIIIFILFYLFYYLIPYEKLGKLVPAFGALWATVLWEIAKALFGYYVAHFLSVSKVYGAFILFIVILFWFFYASIIFLIGAEIAQLYRERRIKKNENIMY